MSKIKRPENLTPMFEQYFDLKEKYPRGLLLFRCGDFYELYGEDAVWGARVLEISQTSREMGKGNRIEMAGVPCHAIDNYLKILVDKGIQAAICEQIEDPRKARGLVKRDVTRVITSGTVLEPQFLPEDENNFLMALASHQGKTGMAIGDISTGELRVTTLGSLQISRFKDEIFRIRPSEIVIDKNLTGLAQLEEFINSLEIPLTLAEEPIHGEIFKEILKTAFPAEKIDSIEWKENTESGMASAVLVNYLNQTQKTHRHSLNEIEFYNLADYMILDSTTWRNLELTYTIMERQKKGSLLWVVDQTRTGMGARLLRAWMERPLLDRRKINARLDSVQEFFDNYTLHNQLTSALKPIYDLERITTKVVYGSANPRDLLSLKNSLEKLPAIKELLADTESSLNRTLFQALDTLEDIFNLIEISISPDAPVTIKEGGVIRDGYNRELDELRNIRENARDWIRDMELREKEKTGIKSLKVKFNKVFGYFIEVTRPNLHLVPEDYIRKQTIANGERFISPELKEYEAKIMGAEEKIFDIEYNLFLNIREKIAGEAGRIQKTSRVVAMLDVLTCFATVAMNQKFTRPEIIKENRIEIRDGRHPVVEKVLKGNFVPNNTFIGKKDSRFHIITGPNMSGKSTYLRQIGLICILAQMGSFVPAMKASLGIIDRVFTRVGASDDLHLGKSTFLVEMSETANIIKNATRQSLILLDEIGRGTSTYDGMSIAWSVSEYLYNKINACTLFATHFHQLTQMAEKLTGVKNYRVDVKETNKEIIFLHKIVAGGTDKSYGIYVAKLAGLPPVILNRARDILEELEARHEQTETLDSSQKGHGYQLTLFEPAKSPVQQELELIDPDQLTPMKALEKIYEWKKKA